MPSNDDAVRDPVDEPGQARSRTVYSANRTVRAPELALPEALVPNTRLKMDGLSFLSMLPAGTIPVAFLDPQYRGVLEKLAYGKEGNLIYDFSQNRSNSLINKDLSPIDISLSNAYISSHGKGMRDE